MQQIYRRTPMLKSDFSKVALQLYRNHTLTWVFYCKFAAYFQNTFLKEHLQRAASNISSAQKAQKVKYTKRQPRLLTLSHLMSTKRSYILKQICSFYLQVCLRIMTFQWTSGVNGLTRNLPIASSSAKCGFLKNISKRFKWTNLFSVKRPLIYVLLKYKKII